MWRFLAPFRSGAEILALQSNAERAGAALACPFSSSAEFEAAVIRSKRQAGVYGPKRRRRQAFYAGAAGGAVLLTLLLIF
jgi:hypothetical protein